MRRPTERQMRPPKLDPPVSKLIPPGGTGQGTPGTQGPTPTTAEPVLKSFHGSADVSPATAKMRLVQIAEEVIALLAADPNAKVKVSIEIQSSFASGVPDQTKRAVSENAKTLGFSTAEWE